MSRYRTGDVVLAYLAFTDAETGYITSKIRPFVVIDIEDETGNIVVICSTKTHKSLKFKGRVVLKDSEENKEMKFLEDTFIYLDKTVTLTNKEILKRIGICPIIDELISILES